MGDRKNPDASKGRISDYLSFLDLATVLDKISLADTNDGKKRHLQKYLDFVRMRFKDHYKTLNADQAGGDSLYCVIRILLPDLDRGRRAYGFKSFALGRMFAQILGLNKNSREGKSLIEYKDPKRAGSSAGNISNVIFNILENRFSAATDSSRQGVMLTEIHGTLNNLSKGSNSDVNQEQQKKIIQKLIRKLTPLEGKWLIRILLKDMHLGFSSTKNVIYGLLHPKAKSISERISDLELFCQKLNDPEAEIDDVDILLLNHFRPMLATRMDIIDSAFEGGSLGSSGSAESKERTTCKSNWGKPDAVTLPPPPFYVETKWDGERFQIHFDGSQLKYFSRRAFDFTHKFDETLTKKLLLQIKPGVHSFILDGEMMAFHLKHQMFTLKGHNIDVKTINKDNQNHCPVFVAFDLVYYNGIVLTKVPLRDRLDKLKAVFEAKEDVIRLSEVKMLNTKEEVIEKLNSAIDDGEEGLIVKDMNSHYEPGKRLVTWLKIKPEYLEDNSVDDMDLVILGAYYTDSTRRGGTLTHFLVGLMNSSQGRNEYYPIAKVGSGRLRLFAVKELVEELKPKFVKDTPPNVRLKARKKPDFMIDPAKSIVVQVKASEIIPSDVYPTNYTLRFPRITKIRKDKSPNEIMEVKEFLRIREACGGKLAKRTDGAGGKSKHLYFNKKRRHSDFEDSDGDVEDEPVKKKSPTPTVSKDIANEETRAGFSGSSKILLSLPKPKPKNSDSSMSAGKNISPSKMKSAIMPLKKSNALVQHNIFMSKVFCVYGMTSWKLEMEHQIRQHGGEISQSPDVKNFFAIISARRNSVLVRKAIQSGNYNVLQPSWVKKCIEKGEELETAPLDYWAMTQETRDKFKNEYDEYGDSYSKENTLEETRAIIERMLEDEDEEARTHSDSTPEGSPEKINKNPVVARNEPSEIEIGNSDGSESDSSTDFSANGDGFLSNDDETSDEERSTGSVNFMSDVQVVFRGKVDDILKIRLEFYGGKVLINESDPQITHVVLCKKGGCSGEDHSRAMVVTQKWLEDCLRKKRFLDERRYIVH